jgi:hypothetical protein
MILLFALQLTLPLLLIALIFIVPSRSILGFGIQILGTVAVLFAASLKGIWMLPPWWSPDVFFSILMFAMIVGFHRKRPFTVVLPVGVIGWSAAVIYLGLGVVAAQQATLALDSRVQPSSEFADLAFPLNRGTYLVVNGGSNLITNTHLKTFDSFSCMAWAIPWS